MDDTEMTSNTFNDIEQCSEEGNTTPSQHAPASQPSESHEGWNALDVDGKAQKEAILQQHFLKALERFNAGVSLATIRRHYGKLGAKYSPVTFRKKWGDLVSKHTELV